MENKKSSTQDIEKVLQEIGEKHGVSREAVRQMEVRVMKKIKEAIQEDEACIRDGH